MATVGVLAYQGGFEQHLRQLRNLDVPCTAVRDAAGVLGIDALIIPGGESTTIGMLMERFGVMQAIRERIAGGLAVFGTCAGAILLASDIEGSDQPRIGALDINVRRNAYGRQIESFEADVGNGTAWSGGFRGVFIRAPLIVRSGPRVETILTFEDRPVLVRQGRLLAATFHPELTDDPRVHRFFLREVADLSVT